MKILTFADIHLGVRNHGKLDPVTNLNTREVNTLKNLDYLIDYSIENHYDVVVLAGDVYKNNLPTPSLQDQFNLRIKKLSDANIKTFILAGNHDISKHPSAKSAMEVFDTLKLKNVVYSKDFLEYKYNNHNFVFLPTYHTKEEIEECINKVDYSLPTIFIGHLTIKDALMNDWLIADKEVFIEKNVFDKPNVKAVMLGHLHKYQVINHNPLVFYTGSTQRIDFNEERQEKGFVVFDTDTLQHEFIEIESQKFFTLKLELEHVDNIDEFIKQELLKNKSKIENAIFRIKAKINQETKYNEQELNSLIESLKPDNFLGIIKEINYTKNLRNKDLTEQLSIHTALELYFKDKPRGKEKIDLGKDILNQLGV